LNLNQTKTALVLQERFLLLPFIRRLRNGL